MKAKRYTEEHVIGVLKEAEAGTRKKELCRKYGISEPTLYNWKAKYAEMTVCDARRLRDLGSAAGRVGVGQCSDEGSVGPKMVSPQAKRQAVDVLRAECGLGVTRACGLVGIPDRCMHTGVGGRRALLYVCGSATWLVSSAVTGIDASMCCYAARVWSVNRKRAYRLYREAGLAVRCHKRKRIDQYERKPLPKPTAINRSWSIDFVADDLTV